MKKMIFLFGVMCALSLPVFAEDNGDGADTSQRHQIRQETDNKVREMANETWQETDNKVREMANETFAVFTDFIELFGI